MKIKIIIGVVVGVILLGLYGLYQVKRNVNYSLGYEKQVKETICEMIKPEKREEFLVDPSVCK